MAQLDPQILGSATDEDLIEKLTAVRGLGKWSIEMFAFFALKYINIFTTGGSKSYFMCTMDTDFRGLH
jgi:DNA-3-methyladenine glycosylase II